MIRTRSWRTLATLVTTSALMLAALAGPALVSAAPAPLLIGKGDTIGQFPTTGAQPTEATYNAPVRFDVWAKNDGSSNISKLFLTAMTTGTFDEVEVVNDGTTGGCLPGSTSGVALECSWPNGVNPGATIKVTLILLTPSSGSKMDVDWEWSTTGFVVDTRGKNKSHGDAFQLMDTVALDGNTSTFNGRYVKNGDTGTVGTSGDLTRQNPQITTVYPPVQGIGVTVREETNLTQCTELYGNSCFGQAVALNVNNGQIYSQGFRVDITFNVNKPGANFIHFYDTPKTVGGVTVYYEDITTTCNANHSNAPCKTVTTANGKTF
ncbi:MAG TPA: hypothetical protein VFY43_06860, partial [Candidatus Limnocylindria bacterium]|nr:hypothetical protein [Candidatus Limnocylindria bacterium]